MRAKGQKQTQKPAQKKSKEQTPKNKKTLLSNPF
jgi:hypothetical protein